MDIGQGDVLGLCFAQIDLRKRNIQGLNQEASRCSGDDASIAVGVTASTQERPHRQTNQQKRRRAKILLEKLHRISRSSRVDFSYKYCGEYALVATCSFPLFALNLLRKEKQNHAVSHRNLPPKK